MVQLGAIGTLSEPLASLITFFRMSLMKFHLSSQRMSDSIYHITESSELYKKKKISVQIQNILIRPYFGFFYVG